MRVSLVDADSILWSQAWLNRDKSDIELTLAIDNFITELLLNTNADSYIGFLKHPTETEFRRIMFPKYKTNRPPTPDWLLARRPLIQEHLLKRWKFVYAQDGFEVDDAIASVHTYLSNHHIGELVFTPIICSVDKDMKQISGLNYNSKTKELKLIAEDEAIHNMCIQLLIGDRTDNIPNVKKGVGPAAAEDLLKLLDVPPVYIVLAKFVEEYGSVLGATKFAENVLQVVLRRDPDYKFELVDVKGINKLDKKEID